MKPHAGPPPRMRRRDVFRALAAAPLAASAIPASPAGRPNILLIVVDDLNSDLDQGPMGIHAPGYWRLAARGVRFERAYCQYPLCNPSRVSFFSGLYPTTTGVLDNITPPRYVRRDYVTLPQYLRKHGYQTAFAGKVFHLPDAASWQDDSPPPTTEKDKGFNYWMDPVGPEQAEIAAMLRSFMQPRTAEAEGLRDFQIASEAIRLLEGLQKSGRPFFLAVGFHLPHLPFVIPKAFYDLYAPTRIRLPADFRPSPAWPGVPADAFRPNLDLFFEQPAARQKAREMIAAYYACISFMDSQLGRILDALERLALADNTIVVFFSDNGFHLGQKGLWAKMTLFEPSVRVPLVIADPRRKSAGSRCRAIVQLVDLYPTLVELCGLDPPAGLQGRSLARLLDNPQTAWENAAFSVLLRHGLLARSVRTARWRYTEWDDGRRGVELYDQARDPNETENLVGRRQYASVVAELKERMRGLRVRE